MILAGPRRRFGKLRVPGHAPGIQRRAHPTFYRDHHVHPLCPPQVAPYCDTCRPFLHKLKSTDNQRLHCAECVAHLAVAPYWYPSTNEAETARRLDVLVERGAVLWWRRGRKVTLQEAIPGVQPAITFTVDFVVGMPPGTEPDDAETVAWEIKPTTCRCARCRPGKPGPQLIEPDALLKIRMYRKVAQQRGWPPLRVLTSTGAPIHV